MTDSEWMLRAVNLAERGIGFVNPNPLDAMREAGMEFKMHSIYEIVYSCVRKLLGGAK